MNMLPSKSKPNCKPFAEKANFLGRGAGTAKKQHCTSKSGAEKVEQRANKSPYEAKMQAIRDECNKQACRYRIVIDIDFGDDYRKADHETKKRMKNALTQSQVDKLRIIMMPKVRRDDMETIEDLIFDDRLCQQAKNIEGGSYSEKILQSFGNFKWLFDNSKDPKKKLNYLLGFTDCVLDHDVWKSHEHDWRVAKMVSDLARLWKKKMLE